MFFQFFPRLRKVHLHGLNSAIIFNISGQPTLPSKRIGAILQGSTCTAGFIEHSPISASHRMYYAPTSISFICTYVLTVPMCRLKNPRSSCVASKILALYANVISNTNCIACEVGQDNREHGILIGEKTTVRRA